MQIIFLACWVFWGVQKAQASDVMVAVAANFAAPMQEISAAFTKQTGHQIQVALGATGKFYAQISRGAPFEVLLAADSVMPKRLEQQGLGVAGSRFTYATGQLVLWHNRPEALGANTLRQAQVEHLAVADPKLAPYGQAALQALKNLGVFSQWSSRLVWGEDVAQAWQFVATGNAQLGIIALSQVYRDGRITLGAGWVIPAGLYEPVRQEALLLTVGQHNPAAQALMVYLRSDDARRIITRYGYL